MPKMPAFQYAQLPKYEYQTFERRYQTFDRNTYTFSYHPILNSNADRLTGGKDQDNKDPSSEEPKQEEPAAPAAEQPSSSPTEGSEAPESAGK